MDTNNKEEYRAQQVEALAYFLGEGIDGLVKRILSMYPEDVKRDVIEELKTHYQFPEFTDS